MDHNFEHLPLPLVLSGKPKLRGGVHPSNRTNQNRANRTIHGGNLKRRSSELSQFWKERQQSRADAHLPHFEIGIPILLEIDPNSDLSFLKGLGFEIISENPSGYIIVATEDVDMSILNQKVDNFIANINTRCNTPARVYALCEDADRVSRVLSESLLRKWMDLNPEEEICVDIGVSCTGGQELPDKPDYTNGESEDHYAQRLARWKTRYQDAYIKWDEVKSKRESILEEFVAAYEGEISTFIDGSVNLTVLPDSFTARIRISGKGLKDIVLNFPYIFEVCEVETINCPQSCESHDADNVDVQIIAPLEDAPKICVIDSGIQEEHRYIAPAILSDSSKSYLPNTPSVADEVSIGGHGTRVAGAVLYPTEIPSQGDIRLSAWIRNVRVLDANNEMPEDVMPPKLIEDIVHTYRLGALAPSKIFNQSIGSKLPCELKHMSAWAAAIDAQCYENDVLFVQAAGNVDTDTIAAYIQAGYPYPDYLERELCRICDPGQSLQALTVGSVALSDYQTEDTEALGGKDHISAFSRSGPGIWDVVKPDVVEYGGTMVVPKEGHLTFTTPKEVCPELVRKSPVGPAYSKDQVGTSFAAPKVTSIAAKIEYLYPEAPALLYRALVAHSARWPEWVKNDSTKYVEALRRMGYGIPDATRATRNDEFRITLLTEELREIGEGEAHVYRIPIPEELSSVGEENDILIEVTLSYAAKPRRTRRSVKRYLSTWVDWCCSRSGESFETFSRRIYETGRSTNDDGNFIWTIGDATNHGQVDNFSNKNGTLQKDWTIIKSNELSDAFCIAVRGHKGWGSLFKAKYSLVVSFKAIEQNVPIYEPIRTAMEVEIENSEIELELSSNEE